MSAFVLCTKATTSSYSALGTLNFFNVASAWLRKIVQSLSSIRIPLWESFMSRPATPHEVTLALPTLLQMVVPEAPQNLIGDNAYDSDRLDAELRFYGTRKDARFVEPPDHGGEQLIGHVTVLEAELRAVKCLSRVLPLGARYDLRPCYSLTSLAATYGRSSSCGTS
jgi:hypothetical protein